MNVAVIALLVCLAGGLGAAARFTMDGVIRSRTRSTLPVATAAINLMGSFALGLVTGLALARILDPTWQLVVGTGFLGGYTTFSTASFEVARLCEDHRWQAATTYALGTVVVATALAGLGLLVGARAVR